MDKNAARQSDIKRSLFDKGFCAGVLGMVLVIALSALESFVKLAQTPDAGERVSREVDPYRALIGLGDVGFMYNPISDWCIYDIIYLKLYNNYWICQCELNNLKYNITASFYKCLVNGAI